MIIIFLGDLQTKDVVNLMDGKNLGRIVDVEIDTTGKVQSILVEKKRFIFRKLFNSSNSYTILFSDISKIGDDVILINLNHMV